MSTSQYRVSSLAGFGGVDNVADVLRCAEVFDDVVEVAHILVGWVGALGPCEGYCRHDVWSALRDV